MSKSVARKKVQAASKAKSKIFVAAGLIAVIITGFIIVKFSSARSNATGDEPGDLKIPKSEISETVKFYPYKAGKINMELLAVRASDGTIRTAFNTCQICYDSGRGYYKQQGDVLVCQNCGNRFGLDQIEEVRGGCNPVPISKENKTEDDEYIIISQDFLEESKVLFGNWKR